MQWFFSASYLLDFCLQFHNTIRLQMTQRCLEPPVQTLASSSFQSILRIRMVCEAPKHQSVHSWGRKIWKNLLIKSQKKNWSPEEYIRLYRIFKTGKVGSNFLNCQCVKSREDNSSCPCCETNFAEAVELLVHRNSCKCELQNESH